MRKNRNGKTKIHPIGTVCYDWLSNPFIAFKGEVIEHIRTKTDKGPWYKIKCLDTRFDTPCYYTSICYVIYLTIEEAKEAHDIMEKIFENA